jgi:ectoine hydroxylase
MHASNSDVSPHARSDVFLVYSSVENQSRRPRGGLKRRPEFIAARQDTEPLQPRPLGYV